MRANILQFILGALLGVAAFYLLRSKTPINERVYFKQNIVRDTIIKILPQKKYIFKSQPKITMKDTINTHFEFALDTLLDKGDTIKINYSYPENTLLVQFASMPDTFAIEHRTLQIAPVCKEETWLEPALYLLSGVALGFIVAKIK